MIFHGGFMEVSLCSFGISHEKLLHLLGVPRLDRARMQSAAELVEDDEDG